MDLVYVQPTGRAAKRRRRQAVNLLEQPVTDERCSDISRAINANPVLLDFIPKASLAALAACSRQLRRSVHQYAERVTLMDITDLTLLRRGLPWPKLSLIMMGSRCQQGNIETALAGSTLQLQAAIDWRKIVGRGKIIGQTALIVRADQQQALSAADITATLSYLRSTQWHEVTSLTIGCSNLDRNLLMHHLAEGAWPALNNVKMPVIQLYPADLDLLASSFPVTLQHLRIGGVPAANLHSMLTTTAIAWPFLCSLHLKGFQFTLSCSKLLFCDLPKLECLELHNIIFNSRGTLLRDNMSSSGIARMIVKDSMLLANRAVTIFTIPLHLLTHLELRSSYIGTKGIMMLSRCKMAHLEVLQIINNKLDSTAVQYLAAGEWPKLHTLLLAEVPLDAPRIEILTHGDWPLLTVLELDIRYVDTLAWEILRLHTASHMTKAGRPIICAQRRPLASHWPNLTEVTLSCIVTGLTGLAAQFVQNM